MKFRVQQKYPTFSIARSQRALRGRLRDEGTSRICINGMQVYVVEVPGYYSSVLVELPQRRQTMLVDSACAVVACTSI